MNEDLVNSHYLQYLGDEEKHGCGYWSVCAEHDCFCSMDAPVSKGFSEETWASMKADLTSTMNSMWDEFNS